MKSVKQSIYLFLLLVCPTLCLYSANGIYKQMSIDLQSDQTNESYHIDLYIPKQSSDTIHLYIDSESSSSNLFMNQAINSSITNKSPYIAVLDLSSSPESQVVNDLTEDKKQGVAFSGGGKQFYQFISEKGLKRIIAESGIETPQLVLHTHGRAIAWGFYVMFLNSGLFDQYVFDSPFMEWHQAYPFRSEYAFYKTMAVKFPVKAILFASKTDITKESMGMLHQFKQLIHHRGYKKHNLQFMIPETPAQTWPEREELIQQVWEMLYQ